MDISERNIVCAFAEHGEAALTLTVAAYMVRDVASCEETDTVEEIMDNDMLPVSPFAGRKGQTGGWDWLDRRCSEVSNRRSGAGDPGPKAIYRRELTRSRLGRGKFAMRVWKAVITCGLVMGMSRIVAAETTSFGTDNHNTRGHDITITVNCPIASRIRVNGYVSDKAEGLARQDRPSVSGEAGLVLLVPAGWWYKLIQQGEGCAATVVPAPTVRFSR
jgi:hypothetical protein